MLAHLSIGTTDDRIDLLNERGFMLSDWRVGGTEYGTIFQESQLADYRQLAAYRDLTVMETFSLVLRANGQDEAARRVQEMRTIIRKALDYWSTTYQYQVVYLAAQANCETNRRYAVVHDVRLEGESSPFGQPFLQPGEGTVMDALSLIVERGPWLENAPGTGTCVEIESVAADFDMFILEFDGVNDNVNCGSGASVDNLPSTTNFTAEAWIKAFSWGEGNTSFIFWKGANGWGFGLDDDDGLWAHASYNVGANDALTITGTDPFYPDEQWHHVVATWNATSLQFDIALDGVWVPTDITAAAGAYDGDAADSLIMGNNAATSNTFEGDISWFRLSSIIRYQVGINFTPPDRCDCPTVDVDTIGLWCLTEGEGATAYDETANNNDGTVNGAIWIWASCEKTYMESTCEAQSVFVANKHNVAQLTDCYYWDNSGPAWNGVNLIGAATPFAFLPAVPAVDDFVIFGIETSHADSGPFSSLVLDIGTAIGTNGTLEWRYKGTVGADTDDPATWTALTVQDNTNRGGAMTGDPFDTTGIGSVHWEQPADWVTSNPQPALAGGPLGVTGYWVACYVTAGPAASAPTQDNRDVYTVTWPYIEFDEDEIGGDMPALLRLSVDSRSAQDGSGTTTDLWCQRVLVGLRTYERGEYFTAYINLSDEQNNDNIMIQEVAPDTTMANDVQAPTGRACYYAPGALRAMDHEIEVRVTPNFYGRFHAFVRGYQSAGNAGDIGVRLAYAPMASYYPEKRTVTRYFVSTSNDQLLDFGEIVLGPYTDTYPLEVSHTFLFIELSTTNAAAQAYFYDLILIPVDEWAVDSEDMLKNSGDLGYTNDYWSHLEVDGIRNQRTILSYLLGTVSGKIARYWRPITNGMPLLQTGKKQRLWFLCARNDDYADVDDVRANSEICSTIQVWKQQRYSTLRGDQ